jgi:selenocysteine lyase/cysteine desulfurase
MFVVDAIQGLGPATIDVKACAIDVLSCGAQKWLLSPWGAGFVYIRRDLLPALEPVFASWMAVRGSDDFSRLVDYDLTWRGDARRFEFLTLPFQDFAGMNASLELLLDLGPAAIADHTAALVKRQRSAVVDLDSVTVIPGEAAHTAGIVALRFPDAARRSARLTAAGVSHSLREGAIRLAPYLFNTAAEIDTAVELLSGC